MNTQLLRAILFTIIPLAALLVSTQLAQSDFFIPLLIAAGLILIATTATLPSWLLLVCVVFCLLPGRSGVGLGYWEMLACALLARWVLMGALTGKLFGVLQARFTFICIAGYTSILIFHGLPALMGVGDSVGRRIAVMAIAAFGLSYLLLAGRADVSKLPWLPWMGLLPGVISAGFDIINILIPAALPITYFLYTSQNWEIVAQYTGQNVGLLRIAGLRELGLGLAVLALTYFGFQRRFSPRNFAWQIIATLAGAAFVVIAGYRNFVLRIGMALLIASYYRSKKTLLAVCFFGAIALGALVYTQNYIVDLPLTAQRALSFLPGDWDWRTKTDANSGLEWRANIRSVFFDKIFPENPWLGRGLVYTERIQAMTWTAQDPVLYTEYFVASQSYHSGLASALDFVGIIGTTFLALAMLRALWNCHVILHNHTNAQKWHLWVTLMFLTSVPIYWYTGFFERIFPFFSVFMCLLELARKDLREGVGEPQLESSSVADYELETTNR